MRALELDRVAAETLYADTLRHFVASLPWYGRLIVRTLLGTAAPESLRDPPRAAATRPVFELRAVLRPPPP